MRTSTLSFFGWRSKGPTAAIERLAPSVVFYSASAAAIFIGCWVSMRSAWPCPKPSVAITVTSVIGSATRAERPKTSTLRLRMRFQPQIPSTSMPGGRPRPEDRVGEGEQRRRVQEHREDVREDRLVGDLVDRVPDRVLHPRVRREDEVGRQRGAERHQPRRREVELRRQPAPAEDPQPEEGRLQEEREQALHGERRPEDVADVARVDRPVHAELELLDDARDDADREVDQEELPEEPGGTLPGGITGAVGRGLQYRDQ